MAEARDQRWSKLARPNWLAAVVSQRNPTIAVMLKSTTSRRVITRGSEA